MSVIDEKLLKLDELLNRHLVCSREMYSAFKGTLYPMDFLTGAALKRSMCNISAFKLLIKAENFPTSASILRLQVDTFLRLFSAWQVDKPHDFALSVLAGAQINHLKDKLGNKMRDSYLCSLAKKNIPWIENVYKETSGYIHLSSKHIFNSLSPKSETKEELLVNICISEKDLFVTDELRIEAIAAMVDISEHILNYIESWTLTKDNPELIKKNESEQNKPPH